MLITIYVYFIDILQFVCNFTIPNGIPACGRQAASLNHHLMKKSLFLLILIQSLFVPGVAEAQKTGKKKLDSLFTVLKTAKEDTNKVKTLIALGQKLYMNKPDTAVYFTTEALVLATKLNYVPGIADAHVIRSSGLLNLGKYTEALKNCNDAINIYEKLISSPTTTDKSKFLKGKANAYNNIGNVYQSQGNYIEGLNNYLAALKIYKEINYKFGIALAYNRLGVINFKFDNYPEALKNFFASLNIFEEIADKANIAYVHNNIGALYDAQGNQADALKNYLVALKISEELGDKRSIAGKLHNIGNVFQEQRKYDEALKNYFAALKLNEELGNKQWKVFNLSNIGSVYFARGDYDKALNYHLTVVKLEEELGDKQEMASHFTNIGNDYLKLKKYSEASRYLNKGLFLGKEVGSLEDIKNSFMSLAALDSAQANYKRAFEDHKMYIAYRDSVTDKKNAKKTMQLQMQYEFDKKESLEKAEQEKKDALAQKELQKQKLIRNGFMGGSAVLLIFAVILFILKYQYEKIRLIKKERNRISGELHDDIGAELTRITVISQLLYKKPEKDADMQEKLLNISDAGNKVLGSISEIIWTMNPQKDNLESLVAHIRRFAEEYLEMNGIEVNIEFPDEIPARSVSDEYRRNIFLVIKEAVNNITKYSKATKVTLSMKLEKRTAGIEIHDNGTGFSLKDKQNWGNGLKNMDQRMNDVGGTFRIHSGKNEGTLIRLNFPVH